MANPQPGHSASGGSHCRQRPRPGDGRTQTGLGCLCEGNQRFTVIIRICASLFTPWSRVTGVARPQNTSPATSCNGTRAHTQYHTFDALHRKMLPKPTRSSVAPGGRVCHVGNVVESSAAQQLGVEQVRVLPWVKYSSRPVIEDLLKPSTSPSV